MPDEQHIRALLKNKKDNILLSPLKNGRNNRVYRLAVGNKTYVLKEYYLSGDDQRDRLGTDFNFSKYAWTKGIKTIAQPLMCDKKNGLAVYSYIEGHHFLPGTIEKAHVIEAVKFIEKLNQKKNSPATCKFAKASEACFCLNDHLASVENRLDKLSNIDIKDKSDRAAVRFITKKLIPDFEKRKTLLLEQVENKDAELFFSLPEKYRILSPSDFGFHNALLVDQNTPYFFDFEYAGWDSPLKMVCDFFCQPDIEVDSKYYPLFKRMLNDLPLPNDIMIEFDFQFEALMPLYRTKWCCIMLNDFLTIDKKRKLFASLNRDNRSEQLEKAIDYANRH